MARCISPDLFQFRFRSVVTIFILKAIASVISLGTGFRGGLFFATLFLGALGGHLFAGGFDAIWPAQP